jgi:hypothetical protein
MRFRDEVDVPKLDEIARMHKLDRTTFLNELARLAICHGFVPMLLGEGYRATSPEGGVVAFTIDSGFVSSGASRLSNREVAIYQQARQLAEEGFWYPAKVCLIKGGFEVKDVYRTS